MARRGRPRRTPWGLLSLLVVLALLAGALVWALRVPGGDLVVAERCLTSADGTTHDLAPDQAANAATITAIAVRRGLPARAATIAIATAIQESRLRNIDYGDRDSLGLFQQRPSQGWGTPEQVMDPIYAANAFYDGLLKVDGYQEMEVTVASDRVQRSAFPDAVAQHEHVGRSFASALTGHSPAALTCRLRAPDEPGDPQLLLDRLERDLGDTGATLDAAHPGRVVVPVGTDGAGVRRAWVLAHWSVAQAGELGVTGVTADGRSWSRQSSGDGWVDAADASAGQVVIDLAQS